MIIRHLFTNYEFTTILNYEFTTILSIITTLVAIYFIKHIIAGFTYRIIERPAGDDIDATQALSIIKNEWSL